MSSKLLNYKYWIDIIMPNRCPICQKILMWNELICKDCEEKLLFLENKQISKDFDESDFSCSLLKYSGAAVDGIVNLKSRCGINFAEFGAKLLSEYLIKENIASNIDLITAVPMNKKKKHLRGYNQADFIAKFISENLHKPFDKKLLLCNNAKASQHNLSKKERKINAQNSYIINTKHLDIKGKTILVCDDVITTGATVGRCSELLKTIGASKVYTLSICSTEIVYTEE